MPGEKKLDKRLILKEYARVLTERSALAVGDSGAAYRAFEKDFIRKVLEEAKLEGNITDESSDVDASLEIYNSVIVGIQRYAPLDFVRNFKTDSATFKLPIGTVGVASGISSGAMPNSPLTSTMVDVTLDDEFGIESTWSRAYLQDATWDVMALQNEWAGYASQFEMVRRCIVEMEANGTAVGATDPFASWSNLVDFLAKTDIAGYGWSNYCLTTPTQHASLLKLDNITNVSVMGDDGPVQTGVIRTTIGTTFIKVDNLSQAIALNSERGLALITRAEMEVLPFERVETNKYGFIVTQRKTPKIMFAGAVSVAKA